jgi:hypothetical protein
MVNMSKLATVIAYDAAAWYSTLLVCVLVEMQHSALTRQ